MAEGNESNSLDSSNNKLDESNDLKDVELIDLSNEEESKECDVEDSKENGEILENNIDEDDNDDEEEEEEEDDISEINEIQTNGKENMIDEADEIMISDDEEDEESIDNGQSIIEQVDKNETSNSHLAVEKTMKKEAPKNSVKEEIIIDDDEDDDEVQDLSTKNNSVEELVPKLDDEVVGFPMFLKDVINLGKCIAISKKSRSDIDIDKEYSILDCPSQVVPLIIKKSNKFPAKLKSDKEEVKPANPPAAPNQNTKNMLTISDFYSSSVGKFLVGIGLSRVKQWYHKDAINKVRKQIRKEGEAEDLMEELKKQQEYLNSCRSANSSYIFPTTKCEQCDFRSEFKSVLNHHMMFPHMTSRKEYKCNYCQFSHRDQKVIIEHVNQLHEKKCMIEAPQQLYECPMCPYESGVKSKAATHIAKCTRFHAPEKFLHNKDEFFPTITPKPITQEDIKIYEATLQALRFAALNPQTKVPQIPGLPAGLQQQMYMVQQQQLRPVASSRQTKPSANKSNRPNINPLTLMNQVNFKNVTPQLYQMLSNSSAQLMQGAGAPGINNLPALSLLSKHQQQMLAKLNVPGTVNNPIRNNSPSIAQMSNSSTNNSNKPNVISKQNSNSNNLQSNRIDCNPKGSFVMCEICDGYIKDLEQLRTHMHWIHKVRIHPKMLASRPPLNCQKCQWRFFTDQGLERHLLGAHGLVTSNMQDMVNQNQDGGRCTICGRVFTSKLVTHMNQSHKINLKPAHLSYKCTVCSATFNLYRLFENHVYMVHSGSVKRTNANSDDASSQPPRKKISLEGAIAANGN